MTVQIVRFKDGLDVICQTESEGNSLKISNPMMFELRNTNLLLQHWLPLSIMKGNSVSVPLQEVLCTMEPNNEFEEYYVNAINKMNATLDDISSREDAEELNRALDELESKDIKIH